MINEQKVNDALINASENGHTETVKVFLEAGANVHALDDWALRWTSYNGHTETVKVLKAAMKHTIVIEGKEVKLSQESYEALKTSLK